MPPITPRGRLFGICSLVLAAVGLGLGIASGAAADTILYTASTDNSGFGGDPSVPAFNNPFLPAISPGVTIAPNPAFLDGNAVVKGLPGTITVLRDGGYNDDEILRWLFADDDSLPGTPVASLRSGRHREVKRR